MARTSVSEHNLLAQLDRDSSVSKRQELLKAHWHWSKDRSRSSRESMMQHEPGRATSCDRDVSNRYSFEELPPLSPTA